MEKLTDTYFSTIEIEINHGCNMSCSYCPNSIAERIEKGHMSYDLFSLIVDQLVEINFSGEMSFSFYNEPLLSPNLVEFIKLAKSKIKKLKIKLYSNGTYINLEKFNLLKNAGVDIFVITLHENAKNVQFVETYKLLSDDDKMAVIYKDFSELVLTNRGGLLKHITNGRDLTFLPCLIPEKMITITVEGNVIPCFEDFYQKNQMGNVKEKTLKEIWMSDTYVKFRKDLKLGLRHTNSVCRSCNRFTVL